MCIHPRCDNPTVFLLKNSTWGKEWEMCETHGPLYQIKGGGQLYRQKDGDGNFTDEELVEEAQDG